MAKLIGIGSALIIGSTIFHASAASTLKMTCSGYLTNTRADGLTLGQCDLNFLTVKEVTEIEMFVEYRAPSTHRLKINVEYEL